MVASTTTRSRLRKCLSDVDFPANKQDLLDAAGRNGGDDETVRALRGIPPETYTNLGQVASSVTIADERERDGATKTAAQSPIVEELGENRGS
ncbi:DUF2795 domain-containing protein [Mycobacterium sp. 1081908.1]|uniref:DUF2795 domain-containing protein n=1 Tax=Mycobacterium sp. 1081908.1 TaxID=1834066 RepID=UPI0008001984|nr:DUF2795 domain-containing protein [Mycobacterium sp. 1081908.1]OBK43820.1 hypothetical protein A5655_15700 [Mycobacterium sp. 1081908.1]